MPTEAEPEAEAEPEVEPPQPPPRPKKSSFLQQDLHKYCSQCPPKPNPNPKPNPKSNLHNPPLDPNKQFAGMMQQDLCRYWTTEAEPEPEVEPPPPPPSNKKAVCWHDAAGFVQILDHRRRTRTRSRTSPTPPSTTTNNFVSVPWQQHLSKTLPYRCGLPPLYIYIYIFFPPPSVAQV